MPLFSRTSKPTPRTPAPVVPASAPQEDEEQRYRPLEWWLVRKLLSALRPHRKLYGIGLTCSLTHCTLDLLGPQFQGAIINFLIAFTLGSGSSQAGERMFVERFLDWIVPTGDPHAMSTSAGIARIGLIVGVWAIVTLTSLIVQRFMILWTTRAGEAVQFSYRRRMFAHLQRLSMSYFDKTKLGRIISRMTSDINGMREVNVWGVAHIVAQSYLILFSGVMLFWTDWRIFLAVVWLVPVIYVVNRRFIRKSGAQWQVVREGFTRLSTNLAENITGMRVVTAFNRQDPNLATFNELQVVNTRNNALNARIVGIFQPTLELIRHVGRVMILVLGAYLIARGNSRVGNIVAAYQYWDWFMNAIVFLGGFYNTLLQAMAGAERVFSMFDLKPDVADVASARPLPAIVGRVELDHVTFGYDPARPVLHDVSFVAEPGQTIALVGHTGSGKTSITALIARFYQPQSGRVLVDGHDIREATGDSLHRQMGLVSQNNFLFTGTVMDNIRYAKPDASEDEVRRAAISLGTDAMIQNLKDGYQTDVGERGQGMSLGQRQLICFTRAFLADPRIFILDEATSAIDTHTEIQLQDALEKLTRGRTTFVVAHRLSTIVSADQILVLEQGRIIERGRHNDLLRLGGKYATLYENFSKGIGH